MRLRGELPKEEDEPEEAAAEEDEEEYEGNRSEDGTARVCVHSPRSVASLFPGGLPADTLALLANRLTP